MPDLRLHNTLTRSLETFTPMEPGKVKMYCCGPTVYNFVHIGNLRTFLWGDLLRRYLEWKGFEVTQVMNFTDIDDRIIERANEAGVDIRTYTEPYVQAFYENIDALRIRRADIYPKATDHVPEMVELVSRLKKNDHTYEADGSTYYRIASLPDYGKLSRIEITEESAYSRLERDDDTKADARDFVLWKGKKPGEPSWDAPFGEGRPGWHLECSAMAMKYMGETFDIHTGAVDLIFPHHENEIAQSEGATGKPFVRYWVHGEHLIVDDQKMSKSLGNEFRLKDLLERGYSPLEIRYALLAVPYRTKLNFTDRSLEDAKSALERLETFLLRMGEIVGARKETGGGPGDQARQLIKSLLHQFEHAMDDDLNSSAALGALFTFIREVNTAADRNEIATADAIACIDAVGRIDVVLDIVPRRDANLDAEIESMIQARIEARKRRDFKEADRIRDELVSKGILLEDTAQGTRWRRR